MLFVINFIFLIQSKTNKSTYINEQTMKKVKDEHKILIYTWAILNPSITGEEISLKLRDFFGLSLTSQHTNES